MKRTLFLPPPHSMRRTRRAGSRRGGEGWGGVGRTLPFPSMGQRGGGVRGFSPYRRATVFNRSQYEAEKTRRVHLEEELAVRRSALEERDKSALRLRADLSGGRRGPQGTLIVCGTHRSKLLYVFSQC